MWFFHSNGKQIPTCRRLWYKWQTKICDKKFPHESKRQELCIWGKLYFLPFFGLKLKEFFALENPHFRVKIKKFKNQPITVKTPALLKINNVKNGNIINLLNLLPFISFSACIFSFFSFSTCIRTRTLTVYVHKGSTKSFG